MRIDSIYGGDEIYIVGTGPSLRVTPLSFLHNKYVIGLNQAWRHVKTTLNITVHPELVEESRKGGCESAWVIKKKPPMEFLELHRRLQIGGFRAAAGASDRRAAACPCRAAGIADRAGGRRGRHRRRSPDRASRRRTARWPRCPGW